MDLLIMAGAWAAAALSLAALTRVTYHGVVRGIRAIFQQELQRVWRDMDDIENRLSALEASMQFIRQQIEDLRVMMESHVRSDR